MFGKSTAARRATPVKQKVISKPAVSYNAAVKTPADTVSRPPVKTVKKTPSKAKTPAPVETVKNVPVVKPVEVPIKTKQEPPKEARKQEEKKEIEKTKPMSPVSPCGNYELNDLMTNMVEAELQDVMIKVWQALPDEPEQDEDKFVVASFRNEAGDHLRNVLGLNITKRLLNVHNPLYVKVQFSGKPEKAGLREFLKKYNFNGFKRIESAVNMFAAQVKTINDFDRICTDDDIRCGSAKVTVSPIYKFSKCPPNLITSFNITDVDKEETKDIDTNINSNTNKNVSTPKDSLSIVKIEKPDVEKEKVVNIKKTEDSQPKVIKAQNQPPVAKVQIQPQLVKVKTEPQPTKVENNLQIKVENKPQDANIAANVENKAVSVKVEPKTQTATVEIKSPVKNTITTTKTEVKNQNTQKQNTVTNKPNVAKTAQLAKKPINDKPINTKTPTKFVKVNKFNANKHTPKMHAKSSKFQNKPSFKKTVTPAKKMKKPKKVENDYDELDDHDILALISEGIVLDECEGSDQD